MHLKNTLTFVHVTVTDKISYLAQINSNIFIGKSHLLTMKVKCLNLMMIPLNPKLYNCNFLQNIA